MRVINKSAEAFVGTYCQTVLQRLLALGPPNAPPVSSTSVIHMADTAIITRPTDRPPHGFSGILNSQRCNCLMPTRKASAWDLFKSGCDFISKQQNESGKTRDRHKHAKRLCQPSMNLQTLFSHILFLYCFVTCFLMLSSIHRSHFVNAANFFLT